MLAYWEFFFSLKKKKKEMVTELYVMTRYRAEEGGGKLMLEPLLCTLYCCSCDDYSPGKLILGSECNIFCHLGIVTFMFGMSHFRIIILA